VAERQKPKCPECRKRMNIHKVSRVLWQRPDGEWIERSVCLDCGLRGSGAPALDNPRGELTVRQRTKKH